MTDEEQAAVPAEDPQPTVTAADIYALFWNRLYPIIVAQVSNATDRQVIRSKLADVVLGLVSIQVRR